jgi:NAD(P)-dependent dehydrogenase (short-subunit alcohol dehydrogenase family)
VTISYVGQVAIVTGAGRGLGRAYALGLAARGAAVVVNDVAAADPRDSGGTAGARRAQSVVDEITNAGGRAVASYDGVHTVEGGAAVVATAVEAFGTVDILVNNAGFLRSALFEDLTPEQVREVVGVHLMAAFNVTQPAWRIMRERGYGRIGSTGSGSSFGHQGNTNYSAAKAGILGLTTSLAIEGAPFGIRANAVLPYAVSKIAEDNPLVGSDQPLIRDALNTMYDRRTHDSVAAMVLYLASQNCAVNGHFYSSLGGRYARVFFGVTDGWLADDVAGVGPDQIEANLGAIEDLSRFGAPASILEEIEAVSQRVAVLEARAVEMR